MQQHSSQRLFFALWPRDEEVQWLKSLQHSMPVHGRRVSPSNFHITLAFIGNAQPDYARCLRSAAARVQASAFSLSLDSLGYFKKPRIAWVGPSRSPAPLSALHESLIAGLTDCGYSAEERPFRPHVSLFRHAEWVNDEGQNGGNPSPAPCEPMAWHVSDFALVESRSTESGPRYSVIERYPLSLGGQ